MIDHEQFPLPMKARSGSHPWVDSIPSRWAVTRSITACGLATAVLVLVSLGCAGYQLGNSVLYRNDVHTVSVPVIRSDSYRNSLGVRLTEAIQKSIERRTPYKVTSDPMADSVLACHITTDGKRVLTETRTDEPRALDLSISVEASWINRQGVPLMENRILPAGQLALYFRQGEMLVPEAGQTGATTFQKAIDDLADQIVNQMQRRW